MNLISLHVHIHELDKYNMNILSIATQSANLYHLNTVISRFGHMSFEFIRPKLFLFHRVAFSFVYNVNFLHANQQIKKIPLLQLLYFCYLYFLLLCCSHVTDDSFFSHFLKSVNNN